MNRKTFFKVLASAVIFPSVLVRGEKKREVKRQNKKINDMIEWKKYSLADFDYYWNDKYWTDFSVYSGQKWTAKDIAKIKSS